MEGSRKADLAAAYHKEYQAFIQKLQKFHESRGSLFRQAPTFSGRPIDLYVLYKTVTSLGGLARVTDDGKWPEVARCFGLPTRSTNVCYALRQHYIRFLESYEKTNYLGEDNDFGGNNDSRLLGLHGQFGSMPGLPSGVGGHWDYSSLFGPLGEPRISNFNKLVFSLTSGLQNEVDFALNICMLLSNVTNSIFNLAKSPKIINLMLAHIGVCDTDEFSSLHREWYKDSDRDFGKAWRQLLLRDEALGLLADVHQGWTHRVEQCSDAVLSPDVDIEMHRIHQVAVIVYNFSFERINTLFLVDSTSCMLFLLMSSSSEVSSLRRLALDTLDNLAADMTLTKIECRNTQSLMRVLHSLLMSKDRFKCCKAMMILAKLCATDANKNVISDGLASSSYATIISMLTVPDIQLILSSLDLLYALSGLGSATATSIATVHGGIGLLVSLVTTHAESYGNEAISGFRIVENKHSVSAQHAQQEKAAAKARVAAAAHSTAPSSIQRTDSAPSSGLHARSLVTGLLHHHQQQHQLKQQAGHAKQTTQTMPEVVVNGNMAASPPPRRLTLPEASCPDLPVAGLPSVAKLPVENGRTNGPLGLVNNALKGAIVPSQPALLEGSNTALGKQHTSNAAIADAAVLQLASTTNASPAPVAIEAGTCGDTGTSPQQAAVHQVVTQCCAVLDQIKKEIEQHFLQFHFHRQQIEAIQAQLQQAMQQQQTSTGSSPAGGAVAVLPPSIMNEVQAKVKSHHGQMQAHYNKLQQLQILSQQIQHRISQEKERLHQPLSTTSAAAAPSLPLAQGETPQAVHSTHACVTVKKDNADDKQHCRDNSNAPAVAMSANGPSTPGLLNGIVRTVNGSALTEKTGAAIPMSRSLQVHHAPPHDTLPDGTNKRISTAQTACDPDGVHAKRSKAPDRSRTPPVNGSASFNGIALRTDAPYDHIRSGTQQQGQPPQAGADLPPAAAQKVGDGSNPIRPTATPTTPHRSSLSSLSNRPGTGGSGRLVCQWAGCKSSSSSTKDLLHHMTAKHAPIDGVGTACLVVGCPAGKATMTRSAMIEHFMRAHCGESTSVRNPSALSSKAELVHQHPADFVFGVEDESPVTRSIRLSSALILRNIARHSHVGKRLLLPYQDRLTSVAMSTSEASAALASCLFELSRDTNGTSHSVPLLVPDPSSGIPLS